MILDELRAIPSLDAVERLEGKPRSLDMTRPPLGTVILEPIRRGRRSDHPIGGFALARSRHTIRDDATSSLYARGDALVNPILLEAVLVVVGLLGFYLLDRYVIGCERV